MSTQSNITVGPADESAYKPIGSVALAVGVQTVAVAVSGKVNAHRGQIQIQVEALNGLEYSAITITGNRATTTGSGGPLGGFGLPFDFDVPSNGIDPAEPFNSNLTIAITVTAAGDLGLGVAAPSPMSSATAGDLGVIDLAVIA